MKDGLVAPVWSDSGEVPVGEVTFTWAPVTLEQMVAEMDAYLAKEGDPNAKPALPALTRVGGNKRGPGWCDE